jgi:hypothetical protein
MSSYSGTGQAISLSLVPRSAKEGMSRACRLTGIRIGEMAYGRTNPRSRENRARLREISMRDWIPFSVAGSAEAADKYDTCADKTYVILMDEQASAQSNHSLFRRRCDQAHRPLTYSRFPDLADRGDRVARGLAAMRPNFKTH